MNAPTCNLEQAATRRGISLLEVLISIGILAVGLIAALSLVPVGRTYLTKAAVDDRAASVIPAAYGELTTMGLMRQDALEWVDLPDRQITEAEPADPEGRLTAGDWTNNNPAGAQDLPLSFTDMTTTLGKVTLVKKATLSLVGSRGVDEALIDGEDGADEEDYKVVSKDPEDWFRIPNLEAGQVLTIRPNAPLSTLTVYFNGSTRILQPRQSGLGFVAYSIPTDGFVMLQVTHAIAGDVRDPYSVVLELTRPDRVIAVDPLMTTRLDLILSRNNLDDATRRRLDPRRRYFADFNQDTTTGQPRAVRVPRLNWQLLASPTFPQAVALADRLCRMHDDLAVDDRVFDESGSRKRDEFAPPSPMYARNDAGSPLARQSLGRMSWLLTLQPQASGSVADNWLAGSTFDVSIVVYQDRVLPPIDDSPSPVVEGEYTLVAGWNADEGLLRVEVPQPYRLNGEDVYLDDEDIRVLFRTGGWLLLAPRVAYDASPIDNNQRFSWIQIQTSQLAKSATGVGVDVVPVTEPPPDTLLGTPDANGWIPLVAIAHEGVVAVVTKQIKVQGP